MASHSTDSSATHDSAHSGLGHVVPLWLLTAVFGALLLLTCLTVAVAHVDLGNLNLYLALAIAAVKASLVVLFFMHLFWDRPFNAMIFIGCLLFVSLFIGVTLTDSRANDASAVARGRLGHEGRPYALGESAKVSDFPVSRGPPGSADPTPPPFDAGALGMTVLIAALTMFFAAGIVVYLLMRHIHQPWPPRGFPALPATLWLSTLDIVVSSITIQGAVLAARRDDKCGLRRNLLATLVLGLGFLGLQSYAWHKIWTQVAAVADQSSTYLQMFYAITGLHAAHVLGGLVPLALITIAAYRGKYGRKKHAAVRYTAAYWHFLAAAWCAVFTVVYLL